MGQYSDYQLVIVRHGESEWNKLNLFTGWRDVKLSEQGEREARSGGRTLLQDGFAFDVAHSSLLTRANQTLYLATDEMDCVWLPVKKHWRLNERHYGALQGANKMEAVALIVIDVLTLSSGMPSNRIFISSTLSMATPALPTSPATRGWSLS